MLSDQGFISPPAAGKILSFNFDIGLKDTILRKVKGPVTFNSARSLLQSIPKPAFTVAADGRISFTNKTWHHYTGTRSGMAVSFRSFISFLHPNDLEHLSKTWYKNIRRGLSFEIEHRLLRASDNLYRWHSASIFPVRNQHGYITHWVGICTDIEDQKQTKTDLDNFVYMASHDLKLPVVNIAALFDEMLGTVQFKDSEGEKMASMIQASLLQIQETIQDLGEIAKVQKDFDSVVEEVDLQATLHEVETSIQDQILKTGAKIEADFSQVPLIKFSKVNIKSVLYNLVSNGIKFRSESRKPVVKLYSWREKNDIYLSVSDNGLGLDVERYRDKMFQMFRRFHGHVTGSGLGLYLVNRIIQNNGGNVRVKSKPGHGATFTLCFKEKA